LALPLFAITLFVSAFLLFLVQPLIGKMILPKLGGTPQVWNTCMMFFQTVLLVGYGYSHTVSTRLSLKKQLIVHGLFLLVPLLFLIPNGPFNVTGWIPPTEDNPIPSTLLLLSMVVGIPFLVVSTSAPLLQRWFSYTGHPAARDPYFLYGASNLGSLLALVCYPFIVEPLFVLNTQTWIWLVGYVALMALVAACVAIVWNTPPQVQLADMPPDVGAGEASPAPPPMKETSTAIQPASALRGVSRKKGAKLAAAEAVPEAAVRSSQPRPDVMTWGRRIRWTLLAAVPSSLMLGVTSYASVDISPFPLLWVIPLALYLLSFILVFSKWPLPWTETPHSAMLFIGPLAILVMCFIILVHAHNPNHVFVSFLGFFLVACVCHGELAKDRPTPKHLTEYFLLMSFGGMIGGVFNGLFAPLVFTGVVEYPLAIICACLIRPKISESGWSDNLVLKASPDLEKWVQDTGDQMAVAFGGQPRRSTYLLNYVFDIILGLLVLALAFWLANNAAAWGWRSNTPAKNGIMRFLKFIGFGQEGVLEWHNAAYNAAVFGIPMICAFLLASRPWRFGFAVAGILLANLYFLDRDANLLYAGRSYFGVLRVLNDEDVANGNVEANEKNFDKKDLDDPRQPLTAKFHYLMHGTTYHGRNYYEPPTISRLATTYYHRWGPVGIVMERYNWFKGPQNTFWSDARLPTGMIGLGAAPMGMGNLPLDQICHVWSEPPYATIGLGTGTMASYGRPLQHVVYYEIDEKIRSFNLPLNTKKPPFFNYLSGALNRGSNLEVIMGDARLSMANSQQKDTPRPGSMFRVDKEGVITQDNENFLHPRRDKYYRVIVVDAFSSDAIPIHLTTKEAIELYVSQLQDEGVLCMHTSNRHMDLTKPIVDIAEELGLAYVVGHDPGSDRRKNAKADNFSLGHFGSEYVMLARSKDKKGPDGKLIPGRLNIKNLEKVLLYPTKPFNAATNPVCGMDATKVYDPRFPEADNNRKMWYIPTPAGNRLWTDDFSNIIGILR